MTHQSPRLRFSRCALVISMAGILLLLVSCPPPDGGGGGGEVYVPLTGDPWRELPNATDVDVSDYNVRHIYTINSAQPASKPESNSAPSTTYAFTLATPFSSDQIAMNTWTPGSIAAGGAKWYYFNAVNGNSYSVSWNDSYQGSGAYSCDVKVSAFRQDTITSYFLDIDSGWTTPQTITAAAQERVYVYVEGYFSASAGTFAVRVNGTAAPSIIAPELLMEGAAMGDRPYGAGQTTVDIMLRQKENELLASRAVQVSKYSKGIDAAPASPINVGDTWTGVRIAINDTIVNTTCRRVSTYAYFFIDDRDITAMEPYLDAYVTAFNAIAPVNHARFGTENDTDLNGKVIIVFSRELATMSGLLGYFYSVDKFPYNAGTNPYSNEGDIFYMTTYASYQGPIIYGTLAHEYQHMIYFDEHYDRGVSSTYSWLNEALSQAAEYFNGYTENHLAWINDFLDTGYSGLSLTHWTSGNYGYGAIFIRYLIDRFGDTAIQNMCATNLVGVAAVEAATGEDFNTLFNDFIRALVMSNTGDTTDVRYNFTTLNLRTVQSSGRGGLLPAVTYSAGSVATGSGYAYRIVFCGWSGTQSTFTLTSSDHKGTAFALNH